MIPVKKTKTIDRNGVPTQVSYYEIPLKKGWTKQKVMDVIKAGNNGTRSVLVVGQGLHNEHCRYRSENGNKCFIGCFISDSKYRPDMEAKAINAQYFVFNNILEDLPFEDHAIPDDFGNTHSLLKMFQYVHDGHTSTSPVSLYEAAESFLNNYFVDNP